jgi:hypothetical protein
LDCQDSFRPSSCTHEPYTLDGGVRDDLLGEDNVRANATRALVGGERLGVELRVEARRVHISSKVWPSVAPEATLHVLP